jgi:hypothetical protein
LLFDCCNRRRLEGLLARWLIYTTLIHAPLVLVQQLIHFGFLRLCGQVGVGLLDSGWGS